MLYNLLASMGDEYLFFNLFRYITFRTGGAILTALILSFVIGPRMIVWLKSIQGSGQPIRNDGPETHCRAGGDAHTRLHDGQRRRRLD